RLPAVPRAAAPRGQQPQDAGDHPGLDGRAPRPGVRPGQVPERGEGRGEARASAAPRGAARVPLRPVRRPGVRDAALRAVAAGALRAVGDLRAPLHGRRGLRGEAPDPARGLPGAHPAQDDPAGAAPAAGERRRRRPRGSGGDAAHPARLVRAVPPAGRACRAPRRADRRAADRRTAGGGHGARIVGPGRRGPGRQLLGDWIGAEAAAPAGGRPRLALPAGGAREGVHAAVDVGTHRRAAAVPVRSDAAGTADHRRAGDGTRAPRHRLGRLRQRPARPRGRRPADLADPAGPLAPARPGAARDDRPFEPGVRRRRLRRAAAGAGRADRRHPRRRGPARAGRAGPVRRGPGRAGPAAGPSGRPGRTVPGGRHMTFRLDGLETRPAQVWGGVRLVPLVRDEPVPGLRLHRKVYEDPVPFVDVGDGTVYTSYIPHAFVATWSEHDQGPAASYGTRLLERDAGAAPPRMPVRAARRMARKAGRNRLRFLPLHMALEGYLALHFGGPEIAWEEWARRAVAKGLSPRCEEAYLGLEVRGLEEALRVFEIHPGQCGVMVYVADALASAFVTPHPDDYRALHPTLIEDLFGELVYVYGLLRSPAGDLSAGIDGAGIRSLADLREAARRRQAEWAAFHDDVMAAQLFDEEGSSEVEQYLNGFELSRYLPSFGLRRENHIGEVITGRDGRI